MSVPYYGDFPEDATVRIPINTFDSNDPAASVTVTNLADADIMVHKDGGLTQIATDGASVVIDFDSITGNHMITIDTSAHADYTTGAEYAVRVEGITVDAGTLNAWIGSFSIERSGGVLALIKAGNLSANVVQLGGVTQSATDLKDFADAGYDPATNKVQGVVLVDTCDVNTDMVTNALPQKNVTTNKIDFTMVLSADNVSPATGKTVTVTKRLDSATVFSATTGAAPTEVGSGAYVWTPSAADSNADVAIYKMSCTGCADTFVTARYRA